MADIVPDADITTQAAHVFNDDAEAEIMSVLERRFGEQTAMGLSIDARLAVVCLGRCLVSLLASFEQAEAVEFLRALERTTKEMRQTALAEFRRTGRA